jgi:hypothetical protein
VQSASLAGDLAVQAAVMGRRGQGSNGASPPPDQRRGACCEGYHSRARTPKAPMRNRGADNFCAGECHADPENVRIPSELWPGVSATATDSAISTGYVC